MTLIALGVDSDKGQLFGVSDILISDDSDDPGSRNLLPLQHSINLPFLDTLARRVCSKVVIFGNYLFMWSGSVSSARKLLLSLSDQTPKNLEEYRAICIDHLKEMREEEKRKGLPDGFFRKV